MILQTENVRYLIEPGKSFAGKISEKGYNTYCFVERPI